MSFLSSKSSIRGGGGINGAGAGVTGWEVVSVGLFAPGVELLLGNMGLFGVDIGAGPGVGVGVGLGVCTVGVLLFSSGLGLGFIFVMRNDSLAPELLGSHSKIL